MQVPAVSRLITVQYSLPTSSSRKWHRSAQKIPASIVSGGVSSPSFSQAICICICICICKLADFSRFIKTLEFLSCVVLKPQMTSALFAYENVYAYAYAYVCTPSYPSSVCRTTVTFSRTKSAVGKRPTETPCREGKSHFATARSCKVYCQNR